MGLLPLVLLVAEFTHCVIVSDAIIMAEAIGICILCTNLWMCLHVLVFDFVEFATHVVQ